jgi:prepilin-type N-terminal cleavage/methylation domain-containing protein
MTLTTPLTRRRGFTLVELLVAMALIIFIMVILTEAFTAGTGVFRTLKAQGDMEAKLRNAQNILRDDLRQAHFDTNQKTLSNLFTSQANVPSAGYFYIRQDVAGQLSIPEGTDGSLFSFRMPDALTTLCFTVRKNGIQPGDYWTARIPGQQQYAALPQFLGSEQMLLQQGPNDYRQSWTTVPQPIMQNTPSGTLVSLWAEVGWFLTPEPVQTSNANGLTALPLYTLRRRHRVIVPDDPTQITASLLNSNANNSANRIPVLAPQPNPTVNLWAARYAEVSCFPDPNSPPNVTYLYFNTPSDMLNANRQVMPYLPWSRAPFFQSPWPLGATIPGLNVTDGQSDWTGDDIVISDVISFNVRILAKDFNSIITNVPNVVPLTNPQTGAPDFLDVSAANATYAPVPPNPVNPHYNTAFFNATSSPPSYSIQALEITIRVWDAKTSLARQITIVQDM